MNIYLLHIGYIIGVAFLSALLTFILDQLLFDEELEDASNPGPALAVAILIFTVAMLLSYY